MLSSFYQKKHGSDSANICATYNGIDLIKFFCSIMVFIIHVPPFQGDFPRLFAYVNFGFQHYLCRLAVPFFFVSSGFFLFGKMSLDDINTERIKNYCQRLVFLIGIWNILLFFGGTWHIWYLSATVIAVILVSMCFYYHIRLRTICILACILYAVGLLGDSYYGMIEPLANITMVKFIFKSYSVFFQTTRNGFFMGFIFVLMGALFSQHKIKLKLTTALSGFFLSMFFLLVEVFLLTYYEISIDHNMYIFLIPSVFFLFIIAYTLELKDHIIYRQLRKIGTLIYFSHVFIYKIIMLIAEKMNIHCNIDILPYHFFISLLLTILLSVIVNWLSTKDNFRWLNLLT